MTVLATLARARKIERISDESELWSGFGMFAEASGVSVTERTALNLMAVYACVRVLAEGEAMLPLILYRRGKNGSRDRATNHPTWKVLHEAPNPEMSPFTFRETLMGHVLLRGNALAEIVWGRDGYPKELWPIEPERWWVERLHEGRGPLRYWVTQHTGEPRPLPASDVIHLKGLGRNGLLGYSPLQIMRESIGMGLALQEYGARFFGNGSRPGGVLQTDQELTDEAWKRLKQDWEEVHKGPANAHKVAVLELGAKWQAVGVPPEDAQFLATRDNMVKEIARAFRVPLHLLAELDRATHTNAEVTGRDFIRWSLGAWLVKLEQELTTKLLLPRDRSVYYIEHLVDALQRADTKERWETYATAIGNAMMTPNQALQRESMPTYEGGDRRYMPLNWMEVPAEGQPVGADDEPPPDGDAGRSGSLEVFSRRNLPGTEFRGVIHRHRLRAAHLPLLRREADNLVAREVEEIRRAAGRITSRGDGDFLAWLEHFYRGFREPARSGMRPVLTTYMASVAAQAVEDVSAGAEFNSDQFLQEYLKTFGLRHTREGEQQLAALVRDTEDREAAEQAVRERLDEWEEKRGEKIGRREATRASAAIAIAAWSSLGISEKIWHAFGTNCPACSRLHGRRVSITEAFLRPGEKLVDLVVKQLIGHPPAHGGCDCGLRVARR